MNKQHKQSTNSSRAPKRAHDAHKAHKKPPTPVKTPVTPQPADMPAGDDAVYVSTDGSFIPGTRPTMGWAWIEHGTGAHDSGGALGGDITLGELCAILQALRSHPGPQTLVLEVDSQTAISYATRRNVVWSSSGWVKENGNPAPFFTSVVRAIHVAMEAREGEVLFIWVKGHKGDEFNEQADKLAHEYATLCHDFYAPSKLPSEAQVDLMRIPLHLSGQTIQAGNGSAQGVSDSSDSTVAKAHAARDTIAAVNRVGAPLPDMRRLGIGQMKGGDPAAGGQGVAETHSDEPAAVASLAGAVDEDKNVTRPQSENVTQSQSSTPPSAAEPPLSPEALRQALTVARLLNATAASVRDASESFGKMTKAYAKAAATPPSARIATVETALLDAAAGQEATANDMHALITSLLEH